MTSMAQDYARNQPLELASIAEATFEAATEQGIAMPTSQAMAGLAAYLSAARRAGALPCPADLSPSLDPLCGTSRARPCGTKRRRST